MSGCGTQAGYQAHRKRGEAACEDCREANRRYGQVWNEQNPGRRAGYKAAHEARNAVRDRALERLAREYPERFMEIFYEEEAGHQDGAVSDRM